MANKQQSKKRRVQAAAAEEARLAAAAKRDRRRRLMVGGVIGFLALALIAPLTAGIFLAGSDEPTLDTTTTTSLPELPWVPPSQEGVVLVDATPCPATDGTAERTTGFATAPPQCIEADSLHELTFATAEGEFTLPVDASLDADAANLAVTFGHYRTYEGTTVQRFADDGLLWIGGVGGDTGFTIASTPTDADDPYPVGSVVLVSEIGTAALDGKIAVVLGEQGQALLSTDPHHVVIGMVDDVAALLDVAEGTITEVTATETG